MIPMVLSDVDAEGAYYNLTPASGSRAIDSFIPDSDPALAQRFITAVEQPIAPNDYTGGIIDIQGDGTTQRIMKPKEIVSNYVVMGRVQAFAAVNSGMNISDRDWMRNNTFWVFDDWNQDLGQISIETLMTQNWRKCVIPNGPYIAQDRLIQQMKALSNEVTFEWLPSMRLKYTGTKPIMLPITPDYTFEYLKEHNNFDIVSQTDTIPSNVSGLAQPTGASVANTTYTVSVNGVNLPLQYETPEFWAYALFHKLGYNAPLVSTPIALQRTYCTYNMKRSNVPNVATSNITQLIEGVGEMFMIIYPGAIASCQGNMMGGMMTLSVICDEVERIGGFNAAIARFPISSVPPFTQYDLGVATNQTLHWYTLRAGNSGFRKLHIRFVDDFGNPYLLTQGPSSLQMLIAYRESHSG